MNPRHDLDYYQQAEKVDDKAHKSPDFYFCHIVASGGELQKRYFDRVNLNSVSVEYGTKGSTHYDTA